MDDRSSGIGSSRPGPIELGLAPRGEAVLRGLIRPRRARRRHGAGTKFPHNLFPRLRSLTDMLHVDLVECQSRRLDTLVVARHAVLIQECALGRGARGY